MAAAACGGQPEGPQPLVFAAASLRTALDEAEPICRTSMDAAFVASYAGSSALARQIQEGAPADIFISADLDWMDELERTGHIRPGTRVNLLGNGLVLVAPAGRLSAESLVIGPGFPLASALGDGRLAMADPDAVPAGRYTKAALTRLGVWAEVADRIAPAENVRAALLLVSRGEAPLGVVYRTDAAADPGVVVVDTFAADMHPRIVYPAAITREATPAAGAVLECLQSAPARAVFERWGFGVETGPGQP